VAKGEAAQVAEGEAVTEPSTPSQYACPDCLYDLRAAVAEPNGRIRCPECGGSWKHRQLGRPLTAEDRMGPALWTLSTYGPAIALPLMVLGLSALSDDDETVTFGIPLVVLIVYAIGHSAMTTASQSLWCLHVVFRAIAFVVMNIILAVLLSPAVLFIALFVLRVLGIR
jgi:hypothetical protein